MDLPPQGWMEIAMWDDCANLRRPGYIFEVQNAEGQTVQTDDCGPVIQWPLDWPAPIRFRLIPQPAIEHSTPIPLPENR